MPDHELPEDLTPAQYRRLARQALAKTDPHYGVGRIWLEVADIYARLAQSAADERTDP